MEFISAARIYLIPCPGPQFIWWMCMLEQPVWIDTQSSPEIGRLDINGVYMHINLFYLLNQTTWSITNLKLVINYGFLEVCLWYFLFLSLMQPWRHKRRTMYQKLSSSVPFIVLRGLHFTNMTTHKRTRAMKYTTWVQNH